MNVLLQLEKVWREQCKVGGLQELDSRAKALINFTTLEEKAKEKKFVVFGKADR